jgi:hypothetical protein
MKSNPGKIAADAIEGAPEVRRLVMRIVQDNRRGVESLLYVRTAFQAQTLSLCPSHDPCKCEIGDKVVVVV